MTAGAANPRAFDALATLEDGDLFAQLSTGLDLCVRNAQYLWSCAATLVENDCRRGAGILAGFAAEEAAKFLILIDAARCPRNSLRDHLVKCSDHLARLLYAEAIQLAPARFRELRRYLEARCASHYLDGPSDGEYEWICENATLRARERMMYVDYVDEDGARRWASPLDFQHVRDEVGPNHPIALELAEALSAVGAATTAGLHIVAATWRGVAITDDMPLAEIEVLNEATLRALRQCEFGDAGDGTHLELIRQRWTFPLHSLHLRKKRVSSETLQARRDAANRMLRGAE